MFSAGRNSASAEVSFVYKGGDSAVMPLFSKDPKWVPSNGPQLAPTNMEEQKSPFQEESSPSTGVCALLCRLVGGCSLHQMTMMGYMGLIKDPVSMG